VYHHVDTRFAPHDAGLEDYSVHQHGPAKKSRGREAADKNAAAAEGLLAGYGDALGIACLAGLVLAFFWRAVLLRGYLFYGDIPLSFEPAKALLHDSLEAGRLPLWSPWIFAGYPVAAEGQITAFYPVSVLISWLLPSLGAINWLVVLHVMLAGVSTYLLARLLGASPFGAWLAGLTYAFSGFLFAHIHHVSLLCAASWMPLVICFVERASRGALVPDAIPAALCWAAAALCGHPQMLFHISLVVLFWVAWRWRESTGSRHRTQPGRAAGALALTFALGLVILGGARRKGWSLAGLGAAALVLALAAGSPLHELLRFLPGFSDFRAPARYVSIFTFSAALLAASGWSALAEWRWVRTGRRLLSRSGDNSAISSGPVAYKPLKLNRKAASKGNYPV